MLNISELGTIYAGRDNTDKNRNLQHKTYLVGSSGQKFAIQQASFYVLRVQSAKSKKKIDGLYARIIHGYTYIRSILRYGAKMRD